MQKRKLILGDYDTAVEGWTLSALKLSDPVHQSNLLEVRGRSGRLDLSTVLTDGEPCFDSRTLTATLECSDGTRDDRLVLVDDIINRLNGRNMGIVLPDSPDRYITGRVSVGELYNDPAHAAVSISAICDPWRYNQTETRVTLTASAAEKVAVLSNSGRLVVMPNVEVTGGNLTIESGGKVWQLTPGSYVLPTLQLRPGNTPLTYKGTGGIIFNYREAVL